MKSRLCVLLTLLCLTTSVGWAQSENWLQESDRVSYRLDTPRSRMISYQNADAALSQNPSKSTYVQSLDGVWSAQFFAQPTTIDTLLTNPDTNTIGWASIDLPQTKPTKAWGAIYRCDFKMPFAWVDREIILHLGSVSHAYRLYINGALAGYQTDAHTGSDFDITSYVREGRNVLALVAYSTPLSAQKLENQPVEAGVTLTGSCYIVAQPKVRIRDYVLDTRFDPTGKNGLMSLGMIVKTHLLNAKSVTVYYNLFDPSGKEVSSGKRDAKFDMRREDTVRFFVNLLQIEKWSHEIPQCYTLNLKLQHEGRYTEYMSLTLGFRNVELTPNGILINNRPIDLWGIDYDIPASEEEIVLDLNRFRTLGINLLRVRHYPQQDRFYTLCDQHGFYVCNQANIDTRLSPTTLAVGGNPSNDPQWEAAIRERVLNMYHEMQNHPSVILFSLGGNASRGYNLYEAYLTLKGVEKSRPIIYEGAGAEWNSDMIIGTPKHRNNSDSRPSLQFYTVEHWEKSVHKKPYIALKVLNESQASVEIFNGYGSTNLNSFTTSYSIGSGKKIAREGVLDINLLPQEKGQTKLPLEGLKAGKYLVKVRVAQKNDTPWVKVGATISEVSFPLVIPKITKVNAK